MPLLAFAATEARQELGIDSAAAIGNPKGSPITGDELDRRTEELASLMRCPVCQGLSIADSPTILAQAMKSEVHDLLAAGYTEDQIIAYFEQSYGEFVRLEPKATGFNLVVWIAPVVALLIGAALIVSRLRKSSAPADPDLAETTAAEDLEKYRQQVHREISS